MADTYEFSDGFYTNTLVVNKWIPHLVQTLLNKKKLLLAFVQIQQQQGWTRLDEQDHSFNSLWWAKFRFREHSPYTRTSGRLSNWGEEEAKCRKLLLYMSQTKTVFVFMHGLHSFSTNCKESWTTWTWCECNFCTVMEVYLGLYSPWRLQCSVCNLRIA